MNILVISNLFPPYTLGGYEILCGQVCSELRHRGHEVLVLTSNHGCRAGVPGCSGDGVDRSLRLYLPFEFSAQLMRRRRWQTGRHNYRITRAVIDQQNPDLVFVWSQLRLTLGSARAAQDSLLPVVFTFNDEHVAGYLPSEFGISPKSLVRFLLDRFLFPSITLRGLRFDHSTCISNLLKNRLVQKGVPISQSEVIYQGIPVSRFPLKAIPGRIGKPVRLLYVGQLHPYKGVHNLIEAVGLIMGGKVPAGLEGEAVVLPQFSVSIVGTGPNDYVQRLSRMAESCPAEFTFAGRVPHENLPAIYREHDVFVFPSIWEEPFGLTHLEAMASGTPVISTAEGGHGEFLEHERNSLVFRKEDSQELGTQILRLIFDPDLARALALNARRTVESQFTLERYVTRLEELLLSAVASGRGPTGRAPAA